LDIGQLDIVKRSGNDGEGALEEDLVLIVDNKWMDHEDDNEFTQKIMSLLGEMLKVTGW